jgi:NADPH:quinone reductase-like Zn-dependent oxidoreductase
MSGGTLDLAAVFAKLLSIYGSYMKSYMGTQGELLEAAALFFAGRLPPAIDCTFPLAEAARAEQRWEESAQFGKIVLEV